MLFMMSSGCQENFFWIITCIKLLFWILTSKELAISKIRSNKVTKHEKHLAARTRTFSHGKVSLSADGKQRNAVCCHVSTLNKQAKPQEPPKLDPPNLWAYITDEEAARQTPPLATRPYPTPEPRASNAAHL